MSTDLREARPVGVALIDGRLRVRLLEDVEDQLAYAHETTGSETRGVLEGFAGRHHAEGTLLADFAACVS